MDVTPGVLFLGMINIVMHIALHRPIATGRVGVEPTARLHSEVRRLLDRFHGEVSGRLDDDRPLPTASGNNRRSIFVIVSPARLALLTPPPGAATQVFFATLLGLALL